MAARVTLASLLATSSLTGPKRVTAHHLYVTASNFHTKQVTEHQLLVTSQAFQPKRVTGHYTAVAASIHNAIDFLRLESNSELYGIVGWDISLVALIPEFNPYRPTIPEEFHEIAPELYDFEREREEILREQHNLIQAGDSTFPWQLMIEAHDQKHYTLGCVSRFFHEDFGLIRARYVQFDQMVETAHVCSPVGLIKAHEFGDWIVTNRLDLSDPKLVVGFCGCLILPRNGQYGWAIVDGVNHQQVENESENAAYAEGFSWSSTGRISNVATGKIIGRRLNKGPARTILPGYLWIQIESLTATSIIEEMEGFLSELTNAIENLQRDVDLLKATTEVEDTLKAIQNSIKALQTGLTNEATARKNADAAITSRINNLNFVTASQLANAVSNLQNAIEIAQSVLEARITSTNNLAQDAWNLANALGGIDLTSLQAQIAEVANNLAILDSRPKGKFPVVDGSIPPNLVYLDDGSLVYLETF